MATMLKTKKPKGRSQARIYDHTENISPEERKEPVATKEFVRQELRAELEPIKGDIKWLRWVMGGGFALLLTVMIYLHSDTSKRMDRIEAKMDRMEEKMDGIEKRMDGIEAKLDRLLQRK